MYKLGIIDQLCQINLILSVCEFFRLVVNISEVILMTFQIALIVLNGTSKSNFSLSCYLKSDNSIANMEICYMNFSSLEEPVNSTYYCSMKSQVS